MKDAIVNIILHALLFWVLIVLISAGPSWLSAFKYSFVLIFLSVLIADIFFGFFTEKGIITLVAARLLLVMAIALWIGCAYWLGVSLGRVLGYFPGLEQGNFYPLLPENLKQAACSWPAFLSGNILWLFSEIMFTYYRDEIDMERALGLFTENQLENEVDLSLKGKEVIL